MASIFEAKLSSADRKELNNNEYGLPDERKYPLNDEEHVRKAIQFFKFCPVKKRQILANNINKKIKEFNMEVSVSKDNPFYKYSNRLTVKVTESNIEPIEGKYKDELSVIRSYVVTEMNDFIKLEKLTDSVINEFSDTITAYGRKENDTLIEDINKELDMKYEEYLDYISFYDKRDSITSHTVCKHIISSIYDAIRNNNSISDLIGILLNHPNLFESYRYLREIEFSLYKSSVDKDMLDENRLYNYRNQIARAADGIYRKIKTQVRVNLFDNVDIFDSKYSNIKDYEYFLRQIHNELKNEIYIINADNDIKCHCNNTFNMVNGEVESIMSYHINPDNLGINGYTTKLNDLDLLMIDKSVKYHHEIIQGSDINGDHIYYMIFEDAYYKKNKVTLLLKHLKREHSYHLFYLEDNSEFMMKISSCDEHESMTDHLDTIIKSVDAVNIANNTFTLEGVSDIKVSKDGDIKIEISPNKNYMDSYSENHKLLVENWKNKNYDAVKKNLAFTYALINIIERSDEYKKRDSVAVKARAFAINDFKTYLKRLQAVEPDFDFSSYYIDSEYDKKFINVPKNTLIGVAKIVKSILL